MGREDATGSGADPIRDHSFDLCVRESDGDVVPRCEGGGAAAHRRQWLPGASIAAATVLILAESLRDCEKVAPIRNWIKDSKSVAQKILSAHLIMEFYYMIMMHFETLQDAWFGQAQADGLPHRQLARQHALHAFSRHHGHVLRFAEVGQGSLQARHSQHADGPVRHETHRLSNPASSRSTSAWLWRDWAHSCSPVRVHKCTTVDQCVDRRMRDGRK